MDHHKALIICEGMSAMNSIGRDNDKKELYDILAYILKELKEIKSTNIIIEKDNR